MLVIPSILEFHGSWPLVSDKVVSEMEARLDFRLPDDVREFLLVQNGSTPSPNTFAFKSPYDDGILIRTLDSFLGFTNRSNNFEFSYFQTVRPRIPRGLFYLARLSLGDRLLVGLEGSGVEGVYYEDHENEGEDEEGNNAPWWENISRIADTFQEFLYMLRPEKEIYDKYYDGPPMFDDK